MALGRLLKIRNNVKKPETWDESLKLDRFNDTNYPLIHRGVDVRGIEMEFGEPLRILTASPFMVFDVSYNLALACEGTSIRSVILLPTSDIAKTSGAVILMYPFNDKIVVVPDEDHKAKFAVLDSSMQNKSNVSYRDLYTCESLVKMELMTLAKEGNVRLFSL